MQENPMRAIYNFIASNGTVRPPIIGSRAASVSRDDVRVTEIINGILVSRQATTMKEPEVIDLQEYGKSKAGSVSAMSINKAKAIHDFFFSNVRA